MNPHDISKRTQHIQRPGGSFDPVLRLRPCRWVFKLRGLEHRSMSDHLPWIRYYGGDAHRDKTSRIHQLTKAERWDWWVLTYELAQCRNAVTGERGHGYDGAGNVILDDKWRTVCGQRADRWRTLVVKLTDKLRLLYRDGNGALCLGDPSKVVPPEDVTNAERQSNWRQRRKNNAVSNGTVTPIDSDPDSDSETDKGEGVSSTGGKEVGRAANLQAKQLADMFIQRQKPRTENRDKVAERFESVLEAGALTVSELNSAIIEKRRKDEPSWDMIKRIAPIDTNNGKTRTQQMIERYRKKKEADQHGDD